MIEVARIGEERSSKMSG